MDKTSLKKKLELSKEKWIEFINDHEKTDIFHTYDIAKVYYFTNDFEPCVISVEQDGKIVGFALGEITNESFKFLGLTKRTIYYAEPIYNGNLYILDKLLKKIKKNSKGLFIQIRPNNILSEEEEEIYLKNAFERQDHLNATIELKNKDAVWDNFYKDKRKGIKKASEKFCIEVEEHTNKEGVELFYQLLSQLYKRKRHAVKPKEYFHNLIEYSEGNIRILFAYYEGKAIATQLFTIYKDKIKAIYTATLDEYKNKYAGDLLVWRMIEIGFENNIRIFDFGGGGNPNLKYGPREYKERFGTTFTNIGRWVYKKSILYSNIMWLYKLLLKN